MGSCVIACYRPLPGKEEELRLLMAEHLPILRSQGLATDRESIVMRAANGTIVEVFEWASAQAIKDAHTNDAVMEMWQRYAEVCTYEVVGNLKEAREMFACFEPLMI